MAQTLEMTFVNEAGSKVTLRVKEFLETKTETDVRSVMETVVAKNIFTSRGGALVALVSARTVDRSVTELNVI